MATARDSTALAIEPRPGVALGRYELVRPLGHGGMGEVWEAEDRELARRVAVKLLGPRHFGSDTARTRLRREALAMASLEHPNIAVVYGIETIGTNAVIAMELMRGTLREWLRERARTRAETVRAIIAAARGLAAAHRAGIVHRDVKPDNILIGRSDVVKVADFGLAEAGLETLALDHRVDLHASLVTDTGLAGTPAYMAPEQLRGSTPDGRADQYALAVTAWEALTGTLPFEAAKVEGVWTIALQLAEVTRGTRPRGGDRLPRDVYRVLRRGLAVDPAARYATIDELADALERTLRSRTRTLVIAGSMAALGALAVYAAWHRPAPTTARAGGAARTPGFVLRPLEPPSVTPLPALAAMSHDGRHLVVTHPGVPTVERLGHDGVQAASLVLPTALTPEAVAIDDRGDEIVVGGIHDGAWELWHARGDDRELARVAVLATAAELQAAAIERRPSIAIVDGGFVVTRGDDRVVHVDRAGAVSQIARLTLASVVRARPGDGGFAVLDHDGGAFTLRMFGRDNREREAIDLPGWVFGFDWLDARRVAFVTTEQASFELLERTVGASAASTRELARFDHKLLDLYAGDGRLLARSLEQSEHAFVASLTTRELTRMADGGWTGTIAGWLDGETMLLAGRILDRHALVSVSMSAPPRVVQQDVAGSPVFFAGDRALVVDLDGCSVAAFVAGKRVAAQSLQCGSNPQIRCAALDAAPCVLARWEGGKRVYRAFDPQQLAIGDVMYTDSAEELGVEIRAAISSDGTRLVIPRVSGGATIVDLETKAATEVRDPAGGIWQCASFVPHSHAFMVTAIDSAMHGRVLAVRPDGSVGLEFETTRGFFFEPQIAPDASKLGVTLVSNASRHVLLEPGN